MNNLDHNKVLVCYISGMDLRRINTNDTPYIAGLFNLYPWVCIKTLPGDSNESTLLSGLYPHETGIWQVNLKSNTNSSYLIHKLTDRVPDILITTLQGLVRLFNYSSSDFLTTIPMRRLRHFELKRFKFTINGRTGNDLRKIGGVETIFSILGIQEGKSNYIFSRKFCELDRLLNTVCASDYKLEFLEIRSLDILQHWNLDNTKKITKYYKAFDSFVKKLHEKCQSKGISLLILTDHGQEEVKGSIDIRGKLKILDLANDEYDFFIQVPMARFWFHTERARIKIVNMLSSIEDGTVISYKDLDRYNVKFDDDKYGEIYFIPDPGFILFPHDFYHPLANLFLGLIDWQQRSRISDPRHRGEHGYLPHNESEKGLMMILDNNCRVVKKREASLIDVAPTILGLLGFEKPDYMTGEFIFKSSYSKQDQKTA